MGFQTAIFDMDGTLLDSMSVWTTMGSRLMRQAGREPEPDLDERIRTMSLFQAAEYCRERYRLDQSVDELCDLVNATVRSYYQNEAPAKPGVEAYLKRLKTAGVRMYVATATNRTLAEPALERTGLRPYFEGILTCGEIRCGKDSPRIYELALERLEGEKASTLVFEDALHAVETAVSAGFRVVGVQDASARADEAKIRALTETFICSYPADAPDPAL